MRVGILTYGLDRAPTGIGRYTVDLLSALQALPDRPEIVLLTTEQEDHHNLWNRFEIHRLPGCRLLPSLMTIGNLAISRSAEKYNLDLIHDPNGIAPFLGPYRGVRRIVTIHDVFAFACPDTHTRLENWRYRYVLPLALRRTDLVLTISDCSRQDIKRYLSVPDANICVINLWVSQHFKPIPEGPERRAVLSQYKIQQPYLLYVGGINARKNIARLFEAFAHVRKRHRDLILVISGKRQWRSDEIYSTFRRLGLSNQVHFTGYVNDRDLPALYSAAELFAFPSLYEGFGLPPLEAMACGTPVITSNASSLPEVVGDAALAIDPYDVDALAVAIERALTDNSLRADLRQRGIERATKFTAERAARETIQAYARAGLDGRE
jgi:glycosyltransferase involved in cell wall biosynthesis